MRDDYDVEDIMKKYEAGPSPRVKETVMARFKKSMQHRDAHRSHYRFWKIPLPLYAFIGSLLLVAALSFFAGQRISLPHSRPMAPKEQMGDLEEKASEDFTWTITQRDIL